MFIKHITLFDNLRLSVKGIKELSVDFDDIMQIILGSNGSGKSSLIRELSPLPPSGNDYRKGGYKKIIIEHRGEEYILTSTFSKQAGEHSFIKTSTNEELNQQSTQSVQRTLVKEIFNFDDELHEVLTDQVKFTSMSPLLRREWLTRISGTNLDVAINLFNQIKKGQKEEEVLLKHITTRINKESTEILSPESLGELSRRVARLDAKIKELYTHRETRQMGSTNEVLLRIENRVKSATESAQSFLRIYFNKPSKTANNIEDLKNEFVSCSTNISNIESQVNELYKEASEINNILKEVEAVGNLDLIKQDYKNLTDGVEELKQRLVFIKSLDNAQEVYGKASSVREALISIVDQLPDNTSGYFTREKLTQYTNDLQTVNNLLSNKLREEARVTEYINHYSNCESVECPTCSTSFKPGMSEDDVNRAKNRLSELTNEINELETKKSNVSSYIDECNNYVSIYKRYMDLMNQNRDLSIIWDRIRHLDLKQTHPNKIMSLFNEAYEDISILNNISQTMPEIYKLESMISKTESHNASSVFTKDRLVKIESLISDYTKQRNELIRYTKSLKNAIDTHDKAMRQYNNFIEELKILNSDIEEVYASFKKKAVEDLISDNNLTLAKLDNELKEATNKSNILNDLMNQRDIVGIKNSDFKLLLEEINPTNGLIADFFRQFIDQFVSQLNVIIGKVWEHPIEVLPCGIEDGGLNYKFPMRINGAEHGPIDVSKGSNSQVTIVNFAFKIVVMIYLGLEDYPLYLDELAPDLDEKHRVNIVHFVRDFVESQRCSQMFMVSHYETGYGAFTNAQILIVDEDNLLELPNSYNHHSRIIRE